MAKKKPAKSKKTEKPKIRRFTLVEGGKKRFWQISLFNAEDPVRVVRNWGRIGAKGREKVQTFNAAGSAKQLFDDMIAEKVGRGYKETKVKGLVETSPGVWVIAEEEEPKEAFFEKPEKKVAKPPKLPKNWPEVKKNLLPEEIVLYEKHNDTRTRQRRAALCKKHTPLLRPTAVHGKETKALRETVWVLLRCAYLRFLLELSLYNPDTTDAGRSALTALAAKLEKLPSSQKKYVNEKLAPITSDKAKGGFSIKSAEEGINAFSLEMIREINEKEKIGYGGINRKRAKRLAGRLKRAT